MKKILSIVLAAFLSTAIFAQETESKDYLPKSGDISIGFDATPFLEYAGNMFSGFSGKNTLNLGAGNQTIYGRYYIADDAAVRFNLNVNNYTDVDKDLVDDVVDTGTKTVTDEIKVKGNSVSLAIGYQKFRGEGRLRGYYGAQVGYTYAKAGITDNVYGNALTATNTNGGIPRVLEVNPSATSTFGLGGIVGVEYYVAPKICVGVDVNLTWAVTMANSYSETTTERWDGTALKVVTETTKEEESAGSAKSYARAATTSVGTAAGGNLYVMFSF